RPARSRPAPAGRRASPDSASAERVLARRTRPGLIDRPGDSILGSSARGEDRREGRGGHRAIGELVALAVFPLHKEARVVAPGDEELVEERKTMEGERC